MPHGGGRCARAGGGTGSPGGEGRAVRGPAGPDGRDRAGRPGHGRVPGPGRVSRRGRVPGHGPLPGRGRVRGLGHVSRLWRVPGRVPGLGFVRGLGRVSGLGPRAPVGGARPSMALVRPGWGGRRRGGRCCPRAYGRVAGRARRAAPASAHRRGGGGRSCVPVPVSARPGTTLRLGGGVHMDLAVPLRDFHNYHPVCSSPSSNLDRRRSRWSCAPPRPAESAAPELLPSRGARAPFVRVDHQPIPSRNVTADGRSSPPAQRTSKSRYRSLYLQEYAASAAGPQ
ncbi:hypothetical protein HNP84_007257 [Thermocatellispora tengchongensis]|uniref:Uncharacterized protein n=1 Tax=Thermocatellispora tengchongensis TaxID=1073253 RepID=A0A840PN98_9ACTN|nr:hypothetical protein [Thermocatellispora tengchongensis]